jgi:O-antigen ligase
MHMLADNPGGVGLGRFKQEIGNYCRFGGMDAHNQYVLIASETGLQGIATYLFLLLGLVLLAVRLVYRSRSDEDRVLSSAFGVAVLSLAAGSFYGSPVFMGEVTGNFWALAGLASRWIRLNAEAMDEED